MEKSSIIPKEGDKIYKLRVARQIIGTTIAIIALILGIGIFLFVLGRIVKQSPQTKIIHSKQPPTTESKLLYTSGGIGTYEVAISQQEKNQSYYILLGTILATIILVAGGFIYARTKDEFTYIDGKWIISPEYYLKSSASVLGWFFLVMITIGLLAEIFGTKQTLTPISTLLLAYGFGITLIFAPKMKPTTIKYLYIIIFGSSIISDLVQILITRNFKPLPWIISLVFYIIFIKKALKIRKKSLATTV